jgi:hypothetical protein
VVDVQRIWLIGSGKPDDHGAQVRLRQTDAGDLALVLGPLGGSGPLGAVDGGEREIDLEVARALAQAMLEACEVAAALREQ